MESSYSLTYPQNLSYRTPPKIIAEIGCNHKGDIEIAKQMITIAKEFCDVDYVKFQKRNPSELLSKAQYDAPHPVEDNAYGATYGAHREFLEFDLEQHKEIFEFCNNLNIGYSTSVWDMTSAHEIVSLQPEMIKVGSATNTHLELLNYLCSSYEGEIHVSLGMTTDSEEKTLIDIFTKHNRMKDLVLYHCTSGYPVPAEDICLLGILRLANHYGDQIKGIGFSAHYTGIGLDGPAFVLGADYIERHFTLDRSWKGTDHAASLEPDGLRRVRKDTISVSQALKYKTEAIMEIEESNRTKLKYTD
jgi:N-acetylneuraminate synthase